MEQEEKFLEIQKEMLHELRALRLKVKDAVFILDKIKNDTNKITKM